MYQQMKLNQGLNDDVEGNITPLDLIHSREKWPLSSHKEQVMLGSVPVPLDRGRAGAT